MQKINLTLHLIWEVQMLKGLRSLSESVFCSETCYHGEQAAQASSVLLLPEDHTVHWPDTGEWRTWGLDCTRQDVSPLSTRPPFHPSTSQLQSLPIPSRGWLLPPWLSCPPLGSLLAAKGKFPVYRQAPDTPNRNRPASICLSLSAESPNSWCLGEVVNVLHHTPQVVLAPLHGSSTI